VLLLYSALLYIYTWLPDMIICMYILYTVNMCVFIYNSIYTMYVHTVYIRSCIRPKLTPRKPFPIFVRSFSTKRKLFESTLKIFTDFFVYWTFFTTYVQLKPMQTTKQLRPYTVGPVRYYYEKKIVSLYKK